MPNSGSVIHQTEEKPESERDQSNNEKKHEHAGNNEDDEINNANHEDEYVEDDLDLDVLCKERKSHGNVTREQKIEKEHMKEDNDDTTDRRQHGKVNDEKKTNQNEKGKDKENDIRNDKENDKETGRKRSMKIEDLNPFAQRFLNSNRPR